MYIEIKLKYTSYDTDRDFIHSHNRRKYLINFKTSLYVLFLLSRRIMYLNKRSRKEKIIQVN